jgi:hypothetical protein
VTTEVLATHLIGVRGHRPADRDCNPARGTLVFPVGKWVLPMAGEAIFTPA